MDKKWFGIMSNDPLIQFIRNHRLQCDFEVLLNEGSYADIILNYGNPNLKGGKT